MNFSCITTAFAAYNPASTEYVDQAIEQAVQKAVKQSTYTGTGAIDINPNTNLVSSVFTGSAGILVDNTTGEIRGYTAGTGIAINGSVISANGQVTPYKGTGAIDVNASTNVISSVFQNTASILVDNDAATITGNYQGKDGIMVNNTTGEITGYTAGTGITIDGSTISQSGGIEIGNVLAGGVVVYVDPSKSYGLVLATTEQSTTKMKYSIAPPTSP